LALHMISEVVRKTSVQAFVIIATTFTSNNLGSRCDPSSLTQTSTIKYVKMLNWFIKAYQSHVRNVLLRTEVCTLVDLSLEKMNCVDTE